MTHGPIFHIILWLLRPKGIKKTFGTNPIDFKKIGKEDVHSPIGRFIKNHLSGNFTVLASHITAFKTNSNSTKLILIVHSGAFISGPGKHHWRAVSHLIQKTTSTIWLCDYPKSREFQIKDITSNIDTIYDLALTQYPATNITMIGDSVGATLIASLVQRLIIQQRINPAKIILITPVMNTSLSNPAVDVLKPLDPILSKNGVQSAKKMWAGDLDLRHDRLSPLFGSFSGFPPTVLFLAQHDIMLPDGKLAAIKMKGAGIDLSVFEGVKMPHIWPLLALIKEAKKSMLDIVRQLEGP